jgi:hypothetical protein
MRRSQLAALALVSVLIAVACTAQAALASSGRPFIAKKGTVTITFNSAFLATLKGLGVEYAIGDGHGHPLSSPFPALSIIPASEQPSRAPRTPLNTAKPAGIVYIGTALVGFYQQLPTANTQGGILFPEVNFAGHPALEGEYSYTHTGSEEVSGNKLAPFFGLNTSHVKPALKGAVLTLKNIPMTLAPAALPFFNLFGPGFTVGEPVGSLTIKAHR